MGTNNLSVKKGRCINLGNDCKIANTKEIVEINLGDEFVCPECGGMLVEAKKEPKKKWVLYFAIAIVVIGVISFFSIKSKIDQVTNISKVVGKGITIVDKQLKKESETPKDSTKEPNQTPSGIENEKVSTIEKQVNEKIPSLMGLEPTIRYSVSKEIISSSGEHFNVVEGDFFIGVVDKKNNPENGKIYDKNGRQKHIILPKSNQ